MSGRRFIDTNIFVYAAINSPDTIAKRLAAVNLLQSTGKIVISTQVLNEFSAVLLKKGFSDDSIKTRAENIASECTLMVVNLKTIQLAWALRQRYNLSYWDGLIAASALQAGCTTLFTEDMQHGLMIDSTLRIVNPF